MTLLFAVACTLGLVLLASWVNARHARDRADARRAPDAAVAHAWDEHGGDEDLESARASVQSLVRAAPPAQLERKNSLVQLAIMALRAQYYVPLPALAARAAQLDAACGETAALEGLARVYTGTDASAAREAIARAQSSLGGCAGCGSSTEGKILVQELAIALDAVGEMHAVDTAAGSALFVRNGM